MHIRVLYTEDCPNAEPTLALVRQVAAQQRLEVCVEGVLVCSEDEAVKLRFLGSPTVQVNGVDADPAARDRQSFALSCRLYGASRLIAPETIADAIRDAAVTREAGTCVC
jgi:hypothetical protein